MDMTPPRIRRDLPDITVLKDHFDLDEDGQVIWRYSRRRAAIPALFGRSDQVILGYPILDADDARIALETGAYPEDADSRPEAWLRPGWDGIAWTALDLNNRCKAQMEPTQ